MVPTYEQMGDWLEEIAQEFPDAFFEELDGGIQLAQEEKPDPEFPPGEGTGRRRRRTLQVIAGGRANT